MPKHARAARLRPLLAALLAFLTGLLFEQFVEHYEQRLAADTEQIIVLDRLAGLRARLEGVINSNVLALRGLAAIVSVHPNLLPDEFDALARALMEGQDAIHHLTAAPNMVLTMIYPLPGNEAAMGLNLRDDPDQSAAALRAMSSGQVVIAGPVRLRQGGVVGLVARAPVMLPATVPDAEPKPWGLVSAVLDVERLYRSAGLETAAPGLKIAIRCADATGANGPVFFGDPAVFDRSPVTMPVTLPYGNWLLAAIPDDGWNLARSNRETIRLLGFLGAAIVALLAFLITRNALRLKAASERLRQSQQLFRQFMDHIPAGAYIRHPDSGKVVYVNRWFAERFGWPGDDAPTDVSLIDPLTGGLVGALDGEGRVRHCDSIHFEIPDSGEGSLLGGVILDVTARVEAEQRLAEREAMLTTLLDTLPDLIWLKDRDGRYLECNPRFEEFFGAARESILGKTDFDFVPPEMASFFREHDRFAMEAGKSTRNEETLRFASDGHREIVETIKTPMLDGDSQVIGVLGIARDISERKRTELRVQSLNRVYAVLSGINETIVRQRDLDRLFAEACRIAVEVGGFRLAWLGLIDPSSGTLKPDAQAGVVEGYLDGFVVSDDSPGPTGRALKTGEPVICNDIANDPNMSQWREAALERGYRASAAFPLRAFGRVRGVFNLYAGTVDFFTDTERDLLLELARDISFALEFAENEQRRREAEAVVRESLEGLKEAQRLARLGSWELDLATETGYWSEEMFALTGFSPIGAPPEFRDFLAWVHPKDRAALLQLQARVVATAMPGQVEFRCNPAICPVRHFIGRVAPVIDESGRVTRLRGTTQDITDLRIAEAQARFGAEVIDSVFESLPDQLLLVEPDGTIRDSRGAADSTLMSMAPGGIVGRKLAELIPADAAASLLAALRQAAGKRAIARVEYELSASDGPRRLEARLRTLPEGSPAVVVIRDITAEHNAYTALTASESRLKDAQRQAHIGSWELDLQTDHLIWSEEVFRIFEIDPQRFEASYEAFLQTVHPDDRALVDQTYRESVAGGNSYAIVHRLQFPDGRLKYVQERGETHYGSDDQPLRSVGTVQDITDSQRATEAINTLNEQLEHRVRERTARLAEVNRELETFTYTVSHDLKAPLRGIDGYSRLLLEDHREQLNEEGRNFIDNVRKGVAQMNQLIDDLLAYSRMERRTLQETGVDLLSVIEKVIAEREDDLRTRGVQIELSACEGTCVRADPDGVLLVLRNLLDNALKFSRDSHPPTIGIRAERRKESIMVVVSDNGIGFDMQFHDRIFDIFQRLQRVEDYPGTGVGLAIVRKAMARMGGKVWAHSESGRGAHFYLELPQA